MGWNADLANDRELGEVHQVQGELDQLVEAGPDGLKGGAEVVEHLPGLVSLEIVRQ